MVNVLANEIVSLGEYVNRCVILGLTLCCYKFYTAVNCRCMVFTNLLKFVTNIMLE